MGNGRRHRRISRKRNTLRVRRTYQVRGQIYSRLMFMTSDPERSIPDMNRTIPLASDNLFRSELPFQIDLSDYPMLTTEISLRKGGKRGKELESTVSQSDGFFRCSTELHLRKTYRLVITLDTGDRVYPERVVVIFRVKRLPYGLEQDAANVTVIHYVQKAFKRWKRVDKEKLTGTIEGSTLWLTGKGAIVFNTFALEVEWMSQHLSPGLKRDLSNLRYHRFKYGGKDYRVGLHHLCLATCTAMLLRYFGIKINNREAKIEDVAEAAACFFLDIHTGKEKRPNGFDKYLDPGAGDIVQFGKETYPHNELYLILNGVKKLVKKWHPKQTVFTSGNHDNLMTTDWPNLKLFLGLGWPVIIADDLKGSWEHARVCTGLVVSHTGKLLGAYVNDPSRKTRLVIKTNGKHSDLGWFLASIPMAQQKVSPSRLFGGGSLPAPRRLERG